jgi:hypothetical protein
MFFAHVKYIHDPLPRERTLAMVSDLVARRGYSQPHIIELWRTPWRRGS